MQEYVEYSLLPSIVNESGRLSIDFRTVFLVNMS